MSKMITEPAKSIPVFDEVDVLVVGGGPAGHSAAVGAARAGAKNVALMERYNHLGGMATGGYVIAIPCSNVGKEVIMRGIMQEWIDRLEKYPDGVFTPSKDEVGSTDPEIVKKYRPYFAMTRGDAVAYCPYVDPDILKIVMDQMVEEAKIKTYLHSWAVGAVTEGDKVTGVIFESKEGRKAILAKIVIDCTGDGDIAAFAGCEYEDDASMRLRNAQTASVYRLGGVDNKKYSIWRMENPEAAREHAAEMAKIVGFRISPQISPRNDITWVNNWLLKSCIDVRDLTETDMAVRRTLYDGVNYMKKNYPGFEDAYLLDINPQTGTRGSRRIKGDYTFSMEDIENTPEQTDAIGVFASRNPDKKYAEVPYRVLLPQKLENLLVAGRSYSSTQDANNAANLIPHCAVTGHAAGVAAAVALDGNTSTRKVDIPKVQKILKDQDACLPR